VALGALVVLVLLAVGIGLLQHATGSTAAPPSASTSTSRVSSSSAARTSPTASPTAVPVVATDYVGKKVAEVQAALAAKGLRVTLEKVTTSATPAGVVTAVAPVGGLAPGSAVTVSYAVAPVVAPAPAPAPAHAGGGHKKHGHGKGD